MNSVTLLQATLMHAADYAVPLAHMLEWMDGADGMPPTTITETEAWLDRMSVRCPFFDRLLHSMMSLVPTPVRLKLLLACGQCLSSRVVTRLPVVTVNCVQTLKDVQPTPEQII
jgi:hypothetical protein